MANLKVLVTFHWFLLHFVNARKPGNRVAFRELKMCVERNSQKHLKTWWIFNISSFRRVWIEGFWYFSLEIIAFGERAKIWIPGSIWRAFGVTQKGCTTVFKKHYKTCGILTISSFWRVRFEGLCNFSLVFIAFRKTWFGKVWRYISDDALAIGFAYFPCVFWWFWCWASENVNISKALKQMRTGRTRRPKHGLNRSEIDEIAWFQKTLSGSSDLAKKVLLRWCKMSFLWKNH